VSGSRVSENPTREKRTEPARSKLSTFSIVTKLRQQLYNSEVPIIREVKEKLENSILSEENIDHDSTQASF